MVMRRVGIISCALAALLGGLGCFVAGQHAGFHQVVKVCAQTASFNYRGDTYFCGDKYALAVIFKTAPYVK